MQNEACEIKPSLLNSRGKEGVTGAGGRSSVTERLPGTCKDLCSILCPRKEMVGMESSQSWGVTLFIGKVIILQDQSPGTLDP